MELLYVRRDEIDLIRERVLEVVGIIDSIDPWIDRKLE